MGLEKFKERPEGNKKGEGGLYVIEEWRLHRPQ